MQKEDDGGKDSSSGSGGTGRGRVERRERAKGRGKRVGGRKREKNMRRAWAKEITEGLLVTCCCKNIKDLIIHSGG